MTHEIYEHQRRRSKRGAIWTAICIDRFSDGDVYNVRARSDACRERTFYHFEWTAMEPVAATEVSNG